MTEPNAERGHNGAEFKTSRTEYQETRLAILERLSDEKLVPYERDRRYVQELLQRIEQRMRFDPEGQEKALKCIQAIDVLVPRWEKGLRKIADRKINPALEKIIASRTESKEVDINSPEGPWGSLPEVVKTRIAEFNELIVEITNRCTVQCHFCALADKGPIQEKFSFSSLMEVIKFWANTPSKKHNKSASLYWGTDPFDARWYSNENGTVVDLDFLDVAQQYWEIMQGKQPLLTSTAIPLGEELRVLAFGDAMLKRTLQKSNKYWGSFRISRTDINTQRAEAIETILDLLYQATDLESPNTYAQTASRDTAVAKAGQTKWDAEDTAATTFWDVFGPNCMDNIVITTNEVRVMQMVATSEKWPLGEQRFPLVANTDDKTTYTVPIAYDSPNLVGESYLSAYPDLQVYTFTEETGHITETKETLGENPDRVFLRLLSVIKGIAKRDFTTAESLMNGPGRLTPNEIIRINLAANQADIEIMRNYLDLSGDNKVFSNFFAVFDKIGLFKILDTKAIDQLQRKASPLNYYFQKARNAWHTRKGEKQA